MTKMKRYINSFLVTLISTFVMVSCVDSYMGIEQIKTDGVKPEPVTVNEVIPKHGALEIHFSLPKGNPNIAQIVATYINKRGGQMEFKVSRYSPVILVEGFTGTDEVTVELTCIDNSGNKSDVTVVKAVPLTSTLELALASMNVLPAFGGVELNWQNIYANPFAIHVLAEDSLQVGVVSLVEDPTKTIYTSDSLNTFAYVRQYPSIEQKFGFVLSDKWGNRSDTLFSVLTPYKEEKIDYNRVKAVSFFNPTLFNNSRDYDMYAINPSTGIQNDGNCHAAGNAPQTMFNGVIAGTLFYCYKFIHNLATVPTSLDYEQNVYATFDLNMSVILSRVKIYPRPTSSYTYNRSSVKRFKIWGTTDENKTRWSQFPDGWTLIGEYVGKEPANRESLTPEEIEYFNFNQEYSISEDNVNPDANTTETFRYMRLQLMESYNPAIPYYTINEFEMFGDIRKYF